MVKSEPEMAEKVKQATEQQSAPEERNGDQSALQVPSTAAPTASDSSNWLKGLALVGIANAYIIGPMIVFGLPGWWLSKRFDAPWIVILTLLVALVVSNLLIFRNTEKQMKKLLK